jgi:hypothetical protein
MKNTIGLMGIRRNGTLLRRHAGQQIVSDRKKNARREQLQEQMIVNEVDFNDVYLPPPYTPHKPKTYGTQQQLTVLRTGKTIGIEAAF